MNTKKPTMPPLPTFDDVRDKTDENGIESLTHIERIVFENEPVTDDGEWRQDLQAALQEAFDMGRSSGYQLEAAADLLADELPDWLWSLSIITNPRHMGNPIGPGVAVDLISADGRLRVHEKHGTSALEAAKVAIPRARRRMSGEGGA